MRKDSLGIPCITFAKSYKNWQIFSFFIAFIHKKGGGHVGVISRINLGEASYEVKDAVARIKSATLDYDSSDTTIAQLEHNTEYYFTNVKTLELVYPNDNFEVWIDLCTHETETVSLQFPDNNKFVGPTPEFGKGQHWEISIKNNISVCWRIE